MTNEEAKAVLLAMGADVSVEADLLCRDGTEYVMAGEDADMSAVLDGRFTADQLEAITTWMRDPTGVAKA